MYILYRLFFIALLDEEDLVQLRSPPASFASSGDEEKDAATQHSLRSVLLKVSSDLTSLSATFSKEINKLKKVIDNALGITATSSSATSTTSYVSMSTSNLPSAKLGVGKTTSSVPFSTAGSLQIPSNSMIKVTPKITSYNNPSKKSTPTDSNEVIVTAGVPTVSTALRTVLSSPTKTVPEAPVLKNNATKDTSTAKANALVSTTSSTVLSSPTEAISGDCVFISKYKSSITKNTLAAKNGATVVTTPRAELSSPTFATPTTWYLVPPLPKPPTSVTASAAPVPPSQVRVSPQHRAAPTGPMVPPLPKPPTSVTASATPVPPSQVRVSPQHRAAPTGPMVPPLPKPPTSVTASATPVPPSQVRVSPQT